MLSRLLSKRARRIIRALVTELGQVETECDLLAIELDETNAELDAVRGELNAADLELQEAREQLAVQWFDSLFAEQPQGNEFTGALEDLRAEWKANPYCVGGTDCTCHDVRGRLERDNATLAARLRESDTDLVTAIELARVRAEQLANLEIEANYLADRILEVSSRKPASPTGDLLARVLDAGTDGLPA